MHSHTTAGITERTALFHVDTNSEFNAIDRAVDVTRRFVDQNLLQDFNSDLLGFADDESRPFFMFSDRLTRLGAAISDLPVHDGLWQAVDAIKHDLLFTRHLQHAMI